MKRKNILLIACLLLLFGNCFARQAQEEEIEEVPLNVQAWFYKRYTNASNVEWNKTNLSGKECFEATFSHKGRQMMALYSNDGSIIEESAVNKKPILSSEIRYYLDNNFDKFKTVSLKSIRIFQKTIPEPMVYYQLIGKSGQDSISVWFDSDNQIRKKKDFSGYAVLN